MTDPPTTAKARRRVVVEISDRSPLAMGVAVEREDMVLPPRAPEVTPDLVAFCRRRLHAGAERDPEIEAFLRSREPQEHKVVALSWPGAA